MSAEVAQELTQPVCAALFNALLVPCESRTATVAKLRDQLSTTPNVAALVDEAERDMGMNEEEEEPANRRWLVMLIVFGGCLLALLLVGWLMWPKLMGTGTGDTGADTSTTTSVVDSNVATTTSTTIPDYGDRTASVPDVIGSNYYDLRDNPVLDSGMVLVLGDMRMSSEPAGTILEQEPKAEEVAKMGSEIRVVISLGYETEEVKVPDVAGWQQKQAKLYLEALGFRVKIEKIKAPNYEKNEVVETTPGKGATGRLGDEILLRVNVQEPTTTTTTTTTVPSIESTTATDPVTTESTDVETEPTDPVEPEA